MKRQVITDEVSEKVEATWDGTRVGLKHTDQLCLIIPLSTLIILNPREMAEFIMFGLSIKEVEKEIEKLRNDPRLLTHDPRLP